MTHGEDVDRQQETHCGYEGSNTAGKNVEGETRRRACDPRQDSETTRGVKPAAESLGLRCLLARAYAECVMAWAGKPTAAQKTSASIRSRTKPRPLPPKENPNGIPSSVMQTLQNEGVSSDPAAFNRRLQELLAVYKLNDGR